MSGGHWDYIHFRLEEIGNELLTEERESWRLVGQRLLLVAEALNRIDRMMCGDDNPDEPRHNATIEAAIGPVHTDKRLAKWLRREAENFQVLADLVDESD